MIGWAWWCALAGAAPTEFRAAAGGQFESASHGILDVGIRRGAFEAQWLTDTLDLRVRPQLPRGRLDVGVRAATFAAGLWITPYAGGAVDATRAQQASYLGVDGEIQRYLPAGTWVGAGGFVRPHRFRALGNANEVPDTLWVRAQVAAGLWRNDGAQRVRLTAGVDRTWPGAVAPNASVQAAWAPDGTVRPLMQLHAGVAQGFTDVNATRLGGLVPYGVPFAGAMWAEFWVEDHVVGRAGVVARPGTVAVTAAVDVGAWEPPTTTTAPIPSATSGLGLVLAGRWSAGHWFAEGALGYSPTLPRADGDWPVPVYVRAGWGWGSVQKAKEGAPEPVPGDVLDGGESP